MDRNYPVQQSDLDDLREDQDGTTEPEKFTVRLEPTLDLHASRNIAQAISAFVFTVVGAILGFLLSDDVPTFEIRLHVAALGATAGLIVGTFISGFVLMLITHPPVTMTRQKIVARRRQLRGTTPAGAVVFLVAMFVPAGILELITKQHMDSTNIMIVICGVAMIGGCCYLAFSSHKLEYSKCSICKARMDNSLFDGHRCDLYPNDSNLPVQD